MLTNKLFCITEDKKMKLKNIILTSIFLLLFSCLTVFGQVKNTASNLTVSNKANNLITENSVGDIRLGMTVSEARKAMKGAKFARYIGSEQAVLISISQGNKHILTLGAGEDEGIDENDKETPINENGKIQYIEILDSEYKTAEGVHVGMLLADAEKKYGKVKSIYSDAHVGEMGTFTNQPKGLDFIFTGKKSTPDGYSLAGVYGANGDGTTSKYILGSYIHSISILQQIANWWTNRVKEEMNAQLPIPRSLFPVHLFCGIFRWAMILWKRKLYFPNHWIRNFKSKRSNGVWRMKSLSRLSSTYMIIISTIKEKPLKKRV
jgi:hypothetical protein